MSTTSKIATIGLGLASGALLTAWLLTGDRKQKTRDFITKRTVTLRQSMRPQQRRRVFDDSEIHYI